MLMSKTERIIYVVIIASFYYWLYLLLYCTPEVNYIKDKTVNIPLYRKRTQKQTSNAYAKKNYTILLWNPNVEPFDLLLDEDKSFITNHCPFCNCYIYENYGMLTKNVTDFDAILFSGYRLDDFKDETYLPLERLDNQLYIFTMLEPAIKNPVLNPIFDYFFNWTWTYRLDSDISWKYVVARDIQGEVIIRDGKADLPRQGVEISGQHKKRLLAKSKLIVWQQSNWESNNDNLSQNLVTEITKHGFNMDIFDVDGNCGERNCNELAEYVDCLDYFKQNYYFYLAFEDVSDEDYVTEKCLIAMNNDIVPVVYGGAEYSWFLPYGSYLDARKLGIKPLVDRMIYAVNHPWVYFNFFRWTHYYKYDINAYRTTEICNLCTALNSNEKIMEVRSYPRFRLWWNGETMQQAIDYLMANLLLNHDQYNFSQTNSIEELSQKLWDNMFNNTQDIKDFLININFDYAKVLVCKAGSCKFTYTTQENVDVNVDEINSNLSQIIASSTPTNDFDSYTLFF